MGLPIGKYRTKAGSEMTVSGVHGGISRVLFDWVEELACPDCTPEAYADDDGFLIWNCDECGGGCAALVAVPNVELTGRRVGRWRVRVPCTTGCWLTDEIGDGDPYHTARCGDAKTWPTYIAARRAALVAQRILGRKHVVEVVPNAKLTGGPSGPSG